MNLPPPKLFPGAPEPWTILQRDYDRWVRTLYVSVNTSTAKSIRADLARSDKARRLPLSRYQEILPLENHPANLWKSWADMMLAKTHRIRIKQYYPGSGFGFDCAEIEIEPNARILDMRCSPYGGKFYLPPPWWPEFLEWLAKKQLGGHKEAWNPGLDAQNADFINREGLYYEWARDAGYDAVFRRGWYLLDLDVASIVSVPGADSVPDTHMDIVLDATKTKDVPEIVLADHKIDTRWMALTTERESWQKNQILKIESLVSTIIRLLTDLRQQRSIRQDIELNYLVVLACHRLMIEVAKLGWLRGDYYRPVISAIHCFPLPRKEVSGLSKPKGTEDWPQELVSLYLRWEAGRDASWAVEEMRNALSDFFEYLPTLMKLRFFKAGIAPVLEAVGWDPGARFIEEFAGE